MRLDRLAKTCGHVYRRLTIYRLRALSSCFALCLALGLATGCGLNRANRHIAFMGDSLTLVWSLPRVNLGKRGQTTGQMLARFPREVLGHGYKSVIILGGTNDVLLKISPDVTIANLTKMADIARKGNVDPTICEIPPIFLTDRDYNTQVGELNRRIARLAASQDIKLVDYYDVIADHPEYSSDGIHMKRSGYLAMERAILRVEPLF
jgi:lysophospholipase L1-like esterase